MEVTSGKIEFKVSGKRLWEALGENSASVMPKALPEVYEKVEDDGVCTQPGTIRTIHFQKSFLKKKAKEKNIETILPYVKEKLLEFDQHAHRLKAEIVEGSFHGILVKKYNVSVRVEETGPETCILHWAFDYEPLSTELKDHIPHAFKESITKTMCALEAFLSLHHDR